MQIQDIMTPDPECCQPSTPLREVAQMMIDCDCGGIPVCESHRLVGFITDRDIVCRILAQGKNPLNMTAQDAMTRDMHAITPNATVDEGIQMMEQFKVRRLPVVDQNQRVIGIVAQADLLRRAAAMQPEMAEEVEEAVTVISEPKTAM